MTRDIPGAAAFSEGRKVAPFLHAGFQPAYEGAAGALAASNPVVCVSSPAGCGKSTLIDSLPSFKPEAQHARFVDDATAMLPSGETVPVPSLVSRCLENGKAGLVFAAEIHAGSPSLDSVSKVVRLLFDLPLRGVSVVLAAAEEEAGEFVSREVVAMRGPVTVKISPVPTDETLRYIEHRFAGTGEEGVGVTGDAAVALGLAAAGVPIRINAVCRRVLAHAFLKGKNEVDLALVKAMTDA